MQAITAHIIRLKSALPSIEMTDKMRAAFLKGLIVVGAVYVLILLTLIIRSDAILKNAQQSLPTKTVLIENIAPIKMVHGDGVHENSTPNKIGEATSSEAILPVITADKNSYFKEYHKAYPIPQDRKLISVLITGVTSIDDKVKTDLDALPETIAFSLSPYSKDLEKIETHLYEQGREMWLSIPMEYLSPDNKIVDPGPRALLSRLAFLNNQENLHWTMSRAHYYAGLSANSSSAFLKNQPVMRLILKDIFSRGLGLIDENPDGLSYFEQNAAFHNAPYLKVDVNLSKTEWFNAIRESYLSAIQIARDTGHSFIVVPYYPNMVRDLQSFIASLDENEFAIVPPSSVASMGIADNIMFASPE